MQYALFGATGRTGEELLQKLLDRGHSLKLLVRSPGKVEIEDERIEIITGDLQDPASVAQTISGCDAVISAAGPVKSSPPGMMDTAAANTVEALGRSGIKRLVWLTGAGVLDRRDAPSFSRKIIRGIMKLVAGQVLADSEAAYHRIIASDLDYTVVRAPVLSTKPGGGTLSAGYAPPKPSPVSRQDLAEFMISCLEKGEYIKESPMVGYER